MSSKLPTYPLDGFHLPSGGIILRSSDGVEFKVYKNLIMLGAAFFETMFSLPSPQRPESSDGIPSKHSPAEPIEDMQVIEVSEPSEILDQLLRFIYQTGPPSVPGVFETGAIENEEKFVEWLDTILDSALKYDMQLVVDKLCVMSLDAAGRTHSNGRLVHNTLAVRVYVVACKHGLKDLARRAAHISLKGSANGTYFEEFRDITAAQYFPLVTFHERISRTMNNAVEQVNKSSDVKCTNCGYKGDGGGKNLAQWWDAWIIRAEGTILSSPASDEVFAPTFLTKWVYSNARDCSRCRQSWTKISMVFDLLKRKLREAIVEHDIDISEI